jgi:lipoprotein signal peptidase
VIGRRFIALILGAIALAALDLTAKMLWPTPPELLHARSTAWVLACFVLLAACLSSIFVPMRIVRLAAGICAGGLLGNLVSALHGDGLVPDPFLLGGPEHGIAFNLADAFFVLGLGGLLAVLLTSITPRISLPSERR